MSKHSGKVSRLGVTAAVLVAALMVLTSINIGVKDLAGNPVAVTPGATPRTSARAPVNLGSAGNFVILAKTGISTTGPTAIVGDIGVSPESATAITGFSLIMDSSGTFSTSSYVTGNIYASDYVVPTPITMTNAILDMETAYTDAAGRALPDYIDLFAGDISGQTLGPGLWKWGTSVSVSDLGVTITGSATDVWIFQIAGNLIVGNTAIVHLSGGAKASNIFWQVAGSVSLGTTSQMKGIILCQTMIAMSTGATLDGRAMAQTQVTLDATTVSIDPAADITAPTVMSTYPVNLAKEVAVNKTINATFSEAMDPTTITAATFTLMYAGNKTVIPGNVTYKGITAVFTPTSSLTNATLYTATITIAAKDKAGNPMAVNKAWNFTTVLDAASPGTTTPPPSGIPAFPVVAVGAFIVLGVTLIARKRKKLAV